jgi:hypothetical protein
VPGDRFCLALRQGSAAIACPSVRHAMGSQTDLTRLRTAARTPIACPPASPQRPGWSELQRKSPKPPNLPRERLLVTLGEHSVHFLSLPARQAASTSADRHERANALDEGRCIVTTRESHASCHVDRWPQRRRLTSHGSRQCQEAERLRDAGLRRVGTSALMTTTLRGGRVMTVPEASATSGAGSSSGEPLCIRMR